MSGDQRSERNEPRGFAGLADLLSTPRADKPAETLPPPGKAGVESGDRKNSLPASPTRRTEPASATPQTPSVRPDQQRDAEGKADPIKGPAPGLMAIGSVMILTAIVLAIFGNAGTRSKSPTPTTGSPSTVGAQPLETARRPTPAPTISRPGAGLLEVRPPVGRNETLSRSMLNYCLAERIRIDAGEQAVRPGRDADIDRFNAMVDDFNSRCGEYRYYKADMTAAEREVEGYRTQLAKEGTNRVRGRR